MPHVEIVETVDGVKSVKDSWSGFQPDKIDEYV